MTQMEQIIADLREHADRYSRSVEDFTRAADILEAAMDPAPKRPAPTKDAPDPGPGWRLLKQGEVIHSNDQYYCRIDKAWFPASRLGEEVRTGTYRTPIYHNPAKLESAGEGYRFCLVSETEKDASHWWDCSQSYWRTDFLRNSMASFECGCTYRTNKPLPTT